MAEGFLFLFFIAFFSFPVSFLSSSLPELWKDTLHLQMAFGMTVNLGFGLYSQ